MARPTPAEKQLSRRILVKITKDITSVITQVIWQHEYPLLEIVHGEGNVVEMAPETLDEGYSAKPDASLQLQNKTNEEYARPSKSIGIGFVFAGNPQDEYYRLEAVYGMYGDTKTPLVQEVYGRFSAGGFTRAVGKAEFADLPAPQLLEMIMKAGYLPTVRHDAEKSERLAAANAERDLRGKSQPELLEIASAMAV